MIILKKIYLFRAIPRQYLNLLRTMTNNVFVYGTLKQNEPNHHWISDPSNGMSKFIAKGKTSQKYPLIIATKYNIPFILHKPGVGHHVQGEVYEVDDKMLEKLDILEDHPNYYIREIDNIEVQKRGTGDKEIIKCWIYFMKNFKEELLSKQMFESYSSSGSHGMVYLERSKREPNYDHVTAVKNNNESTIDDLNEDDVKLK